MPPYTLHPDVWLLLVALYGGYLYALSAWGPRLAPGRAPATRGQRVCFTLGVVAIWVGADWPVHDLAEDYLYSVHMLQHMLFQLVAPPLLILGTPGWLLRRLLSPPPLRRAFAAMTRPLPALLLVNAFVAIQHTPAFVNATVTNGVLHLLAHVAIVLTSVVMWWPVLSPLPELPHASYPVRMFYLFGHSIVPTVPASFLTFSDAPLYSTYAEMPRIVQLLDPVGDQQLAGLIMKILGGLLLWAVITVIFFVWHREEETGGPDALYWRDLQAEVGPPHALTNAEQSSI